MKRRYRLICRGGRGSKFYCFDTLTRKRTSLATTRREEAAQVVFAKNQALGQGALNLQIARAYLTAADPQIARRTWQDVMAEIPRLKTGNTLIRWQTVVRDRAFDSLRNVILLETRAEHLLHALDRGTVSTNIYLRRLHRFVLDLGWLSWPVLPVRRWPKIKFKSKRAITPEEHRKILARETNDECQAFYQLLWHLGGSQTDIATLRAEDIDWAARTIAYARCKTGSLSVLHFGDSVAHLPAHPAPGRLPAPHDCALSGIRPGQSLYPPLPPGGGFRCDAAQLPLCLGRAGQTVELSRAPSIWQTTPLPPPRFRCCPPRSPTDACGPPHQRPAPPPRSVPAPGTPRPPSGPAPRAARYPAPGTRPATPGCGPSSPHRPDWHSRRAVGPRPGPRPRGRWLPAPRQTSLCGA